LHTGEEAVAGGGSKVIAYPVRISKRLLQLVVVYGTRRVGKVLLRVVPRVDRVA
jgi:hypothetical protein